MYRKGIYLTLRVFVELYLLIYVLFRLISLSNNKTQDISSLSSANTLRVL